MSKTRLSPRGGLEIEARICRRWDTAKVNGDCAQIAVSLGTRLILLAICEVMRLTMHLFCLIQCSVTLGLRCMADSPDDLHLS